MYGRALKQDVNAIVYLEIVDCLADLAPRIKQEEDVGQLTL